MKLKFDKIIEIYEEHLEEHKQLANHYRGMLRKAEKSVAMYENELKNLKEHERVNKSRD